MVSKNENEVIGRKIPLQFADPWVGVQSTMNLSHKADQAIRHMYQQVQDGNVEPEEVRAWIHSIADGAFRAGLNCRTSAD